MPIHRRPSKCRAALLALVVSTCAPSAAAQPECAPAGCAPVQLRLDEGFQLSRRMLADHPAPAARAARAVRAPAAAPEKGMPWAALAVAIGAGMLLQLFLQSASSRRRAVAPVKRAPMPVVAVPAPAPVIAAEPQPEPVVALAPPDPVAETIAHEPAPIEALAPEIAPAVPAAPRHELTVTLLKRLSARRASASPADDRFSTVFRLIARGQMEQADAALRELEQAREEIPAEFITTTQHIAQHRGRELQERIDGLRGQLTGATSLRRLGVAEAFLRRNRLDEATEVLDELASAVDA